MSGHVPDGVAIVGMAARFPGARDVAEFWANLEGGVESIRFFSDEELRAAGVEERELRSPAYVRAHPVLDDAELFDAAFFGYTPREAELMDPQQRVLLECAWAALEDAGYDPGAVPGRVGVFAGQGMNSYLHHCILSHPDWAERFGALPVLLGNDPAYLATRVAYKLNLRGPALNLQTACSTSLVAVHAACQSLLLHECDLALAGGVSIRIPQGHGYEHEPGGIFSPDGHCRAYDARAQGTIGGNGAGVVLLRRAADALAAGDPVYAVVRGSSVNNDGSGKVGFTAPGLAGQAAVIAAAHAVAGVTPDQVGYLEGHGTATPLGDPIEVAALARAFRGARTGACALGSVKTNVGHLDAAAGVAGLIKATLALQHRRIPPSLHFSAPNPEIGLAGTPFRVPTAAEAWEPPAGRPRIAGVSAFGIGGTNAHVVLEEAPFPEPAAEAPAAAQLLVLSARSEAALRTGAANLAAHLAGGASAPLADVAFTLGAGRRAFPHRASLVCDSHQAAAEKLRALASDRPQAPPAPDAEPRVVFLFPGQGAQYAGMTRGLYARDPGVRRHLDACAEAARRAVGLDLLPVLHAAGSDDLARTRLTQLAVFAADYALALRWMELGVAPAVMIGHSLGEYAAACVAGVLSLEDAFRVLDVRARSMQALPEGAMLAVGLSEEETAALLRPGLEIAAVNAPAQCVVSGPVGVVATLQRELDGRGTWCRRQTTSHAFHSVMMEPAVEPLVRCLEGVELREPRIPYVSNVTGDLVTAAEATDPQYWGRHLREPVRFGAGCARLAASGDALWLEVGPGRALGGLARLALPPGDTGRIVVSLPGPVRGRPEEGEAADAREHAGWLEAVGALWERGRGIDWARLHGEPRRRVRLPTYPFERRRYFVEPPRERLSAAPAPPAREPDVGDWLYAPVWRQSFAAPADGAPLDAHDWVVVGGPAGLGGRLAESLADAGCAVRLLGTEGIPSARYEELAGALRVPRGGAAPRPVVVVHALAADADAGAVAADLLALLQALANAALPAVRVGVLARGLHRILPGDPVCPDHALLLGPARVAPHEVAGLSCAVLDVGTPEPGSHAERRLLPRLARELAAGTSEAMLAYRGAQRWVGAFERIPAPAPAGPHPRLRERGAYLVTGGLRGIGLEIAAYLGRTLGARLALVTRSPFPPRDEWEGWLEARGAADRTGRTVARLLEIERAGAEVLVIVADLADESAARAAVARAAVRFGGLDGVVHCAGVPGGGLLATQRPEAFAATAAPKVRGTRALHEAAAPLNPDFFVLFSSQASLLGGAGRADYAAANAYLDAFAHAHAGGGDAPVIAVNWDTWRDVGMAADHAARLGIDAAEGAITLEEGLDAFDRALAAGIPQVVVSTSDFTARLDAARSAAAAGAPDEPAAAAPADTARQPRPELSSQYAPAETPAERAIVATWEEVLGIGGLGIDDDIFELGGDSIVTLQVLARLRRVGLLVTPRQAFEHSTPRALARAAADGARVQSEQGTVRGRQTLTPVLRWFCEQRLQHRSLFNQDTLLKMRTPLREALLERALQAVVEHHDALRLRLAHRDDEWECGYAEPAPVRLAHVDLSRVLPAGRRAAVERAASGLQAGLDLEHGPVLQAGVLHLGSGEPARFLLAVHHLAVDGLSWPFLLEDLETAYAALARGEAPRLPPKSTSFQEWADRLAEYARGPALEAELAFWLEPGRTERAALPVDVPGGENTEGFSASHTAVLDERGTEEVLAFAARAGVHVQEAILAALGRALERWTGAPRMLVDLEGHGREPLFDDVDVSRTVGWFTALVPFHCRWSPAADDRGLLAAVRAQMRDMPNHGIGFGLLRYLRDPETAAALGALPRPEVTFLYTGESAGLDPGGLLAPAPESGGAARHPADRRTHLLDVQARIEAGRIVLECRYGTRVHHAATIASLGEDLLATLRALAVHDPAVPDDPLQEDGAAEFGWSMQDVERIRSVIAQTL